MTLKINFQAQSANSNAKADLEKKKNEFLNKDIGIITGISALAGGTINGIREHASLENDIFKGTQLATLAIDSKFANEKAELRKEAIQKIEQRLRNFSFWTVPTAVFKGTVIGAGIAVGVILIAKALKNILNKQDSK
jgi:hypothetical protein